MGIKIVVDSTADLKDEILQEYGIERASLKIHFKNQTYRDWVDIQPKEFYDKLRNADVLPTTSQPSPAEFMDLYKKIAKENDSIISIHLAAKLSGTFQSAILAKSMLDTYDITVIDSKQATCGTGFIAIAAAIAAKQGKSKEEIITLIHNIIASQRTLFMVDSLEYLRKGGRIGKAGALIGSLLNIKPILSLDADGGVMSVDKPRGRKKAEKSMIQILKNTYGDAELSVVFCHADALADVESFSIALNEELNIGESMVADIGPVIGTHIGPGAWGVIAHESNAKR